MREIATKLRITAILAVLLGTLVIGAPAWAASVGTAQTGSPASAAHVTNAVVSDPGTYAVANIQEQPCTSGRATWVHMTINGTTKCYGFTGTFYFSGNNTTYFCAGNNYGNLRYWEGNNYYSLGFAPGTRVNWPNGINVTLLTINGWRGSNTC
jgi:hypothetical protein